MHRWKWSLLVACLAVSTSAIAGEPEPGRTDGPEGSEYGRGGYRYYRTPGQFFAEGFFGAASVSKASAGNDSSQTDLMGGVGVGYQIEDWLAFQMRYCHITGEEASTASTGLGPIDLFGGGVSSSYNMEPFNYYFSLDAGIFSPDQGSSSFGIVPGAGAEVVLSDHLRVGLQYQHDFIFADDDISVNRFTARAQLKF